MKKIVGTKEAIKRWDRIADMSQYDTIVKIDINNFVIIGGISLAMLTD